ncbi:MAG: response regulator [Sulfurimonas sp.]|nr:response regulator [Sulfurimonas sp.]
MSLSYDILIVDDVSENIKVAISILKSEPYNFSYALNGKEALEVLKTKRFDLVLLDIMMPGIDGFDVCKIIKKTPAIADTPIIFVTAKVDIDSIEEGFKLGAVDYVTKPFHAIELKARVKNHLELYRSKQQLKAHNISLSTKLKTSDELHLSELEMAQKEVIFVLSQLMESRSTETAHHIKRVADISLLIAKLDGRLNKEELHSVYLAAPLHDIGKILVDEHILHKRGSLTEEEFRSMKEHPEFAYKVFKNSKTTLMQAASAIAYEHHENYDGSGYPRGLKGEEIHFYGRIVALADVLDALTHKRVHKEAWSFEETKAFVIQNRGIKFDPKLVDLFLGNEKRFQAILLGE